MHRLEPAPLDTCTDDNLEWTQIVCGFRYAAALTIKGEVFTWGYNRGGQLGHSCADTLRSDPSNKS